MFREEVAKLRQEQTESAKRKQTEEEEDQVLRQFFKQRVPESQLETVKARSFLVSIFLLSLTRSSFYSFLMCSLESFHLNNRSMEGFFLKVRYALARIDLQYLIFRMKRYN
jgi:hypothetical protein